MSPIIYWMPSNIFGYKINIQQSYVFMNYSVHRTAINAKYEAQILHAVIAMQPDHCQQNLEINNSICTHKLHMRIVLKISCNSVLMDDRAKKRTWFLKSSFFLLPKLFDGLNVRSSALTKWSKVLCVSPVIQKKWVQFISKLFHIPGLLAVTLKYYCHDI